jgi:hypothetical protein
MCAAGGKMVPLLETGDETNGTIEALVGFISFVLFKECTDREF